MKMTKVTMLRRDGHRETIRDQAGKVLLLARL
jgi:hypothetical protein